MRPGGSSPNATHAHAVARGTRCRQDAGGRIGPTRGGPALGSSGVQGPAPSLRTEAASQEFGAVCNADAVNHAPSHNYAHAHAHAHAHAYT